MRAEEEGFSISTVAAASANVSRLSSSSDSQQSIEMLATSFATGQYQAYE